MTDTAVTLAHKGRVDYELLFSRALSIAAGAHMDQREKDGSAYVLHPLRLMSKAASREEQIVALLHDVVEDSPWTLSQLASEGFPDNIMAAIDCVTAREGEDYEGFIDRISKNPLAVRVKLLDLEDNMDVRRLVDINENDLRRVQKYHAAHRRLKAVQDAKS